MLQKILVKEVFSKKFCLSTDWYWYCSSSCFLVIIHEQDRDAEAYTLSSIYD